ncbi:MAG TPA: hypothetical protein VLS87_09640 [Woeseiaceae bacterium]|nr:hypothetical protein [Woeseiaceae bacterium]
MKGLLSLPFLAACASCATDADVAGMYAPSCVAFEGSTIELAGERFTWDKFTDEVTVDDAGNTVDPFPGFPVRGTYTLDDDVLRLTTDAGKLAAELHLVRRPGQVYLLTAREFEAWQQDGTVPTCALLLGAGE